MYSGTTLHGLSGNLVGAHQKFDRVAHKFVSGLRSESHFPSTRHILHFEGNNGPDGIKRKSPAQDEPWHYWDPTDESDTKLLDIIDAHYKSLIGALETEDEERAAFEAAWLAHAIVDGLTPAHHYPYETRLNELRGEGIETRTSFRDKVVIKGDTKRQTMSKNWQMWGAKGLLISHGTFEFGVSSLAKPLSFKQWSPKESEIKHARNLGLRPYLQETAMLIYKLNMYERFMARGWTSKLAHDIRKTLCPAIIKAITIAWVLALDEAEK